MVFKSSSKYNKPSKLSNSGNTCDCCGVRPHTKDECYKREQAKCTFCKKEGHLVQACEKKARESQAESLASNLKSGGDFREATDQELLINSSKTDHVIVQQSRFRYLRELNTVVTNPDGANMKVSSIEVKVLAGDNQGKASPSVLK